MKAHINYAPDDADVLGTTTLLPVIPYAYIDLENSGGAVQIVQLVLNIPAGSMLDINGLQVSDIQNTTCGCPYRTCTLGITLAGGGNVLTSIPVTIPAALITGAQLLMIEIYDKDNPTGRPKGRNIVALPGIV
jgi:hypothetical protein